MRWRAPLGVLAAGVALAACGGTQSPAAAMSAWSSSSSFSAAVSTLLTDSARVHQSVVLMNAEGIRTVCAELLLDAQGTNNELPTPDTQLTGILSHAYDDLVQAANDCYNDSTSRAALVGVERERRTGVGLLVQAVLREEAVTGTSLHVPGIP